MAFAFAEAKLVPEPVAVSCLPEVGARRHVVLLGPQIGPSPDDGPIQQIRETLESPPPTSFEAPGRIDERSGQVTSRPSRERSRNADEGEPDACHAAGFGAVAAVDGFAAREYRSSTALIGRSAGQ